MAGIIRLRRAGSGRSDSGYMLLFLMLAVAVLTITMLGVARNYRRSILRDREVEMIHRGEQYERASGVTTKRTAAIRFPSSNWKIPTKSAICAKDTRTR